MPIRPAARDTLIGATTLVGLAGLIAILLLFGELSALTKKHDPLNFHLNTAQGLDKGSSVTLNGVPIGVITKMTPITSPEPGVLIQTSINHDIKVPKELTVTIQMGLLADGKLALTTHASTGEQIMLQPGDTVIAHANTMFEQIAAVLDERLDPLNAAANSLSELGSTYTQVGKHVEELLKPTSPTDVDAGNAAPTIASLITRLDSAAANLNAWVGNDSLRTSATDAADQIKAVIDDAQLTLESWRNTAKTLEDRTNDTSTSIVQLASDTRSMVAKLDASIENTRIITDRIVAGQGAIGQAVNNPDLYRSLNDSALRLQRTLTEAQLLIEKWKAEGFPVQF